MIDCSTTRTARKSIQRAVKKPDVELSFIDVDSTQVGVATIIDNDVAVRPGLQSPSVDAVEFAVHGTGLRGRQMAYYLDWGFENEMMNADRMDFHRTIGEQLVARAVSMVEPGEQAHAWALLSDSVAEPSVGLGLTLTHRGELNEFIAVPDLKAINPTGGVGVRLYNNLDLPVDSQS